MPRNLKISSVIAGLTACLLIISCTTGSFIRFGRPKAPEGFATGDTIHVLLPLDDPRYSQAVKKIQDGINDADNNDKSKITVKFHDTMDREAVKREYSRLVSMEAKPSLIIGPLLPDRVAAVAPLVASSVPTLLLNETDRPIFFFALSPKDEVKTVASWFKQFNAQRPFVVYPSSGSWQQRLAETFISKIPKAKRVRYENDGSFTSDQSQLGQADVVFLIADADSARKVYPNLQKQTQTEAIVATSHVIDNTKREQYKFFDGLFVVETPYLLALLNPGNSEPGNTDRSRFYAMGLDAYALGALVAKGQSSSLTLKDGRTGSDIILGKGRLTRTLALGRFKTISQAGRKKDGVLAPEKLETLKSAITASR